MTEIIDNHPPIEDKPERRATIRESNKKLDEAVDHLSDVLSHMKVQDNHRELANSVLTLRNSQLFGFTLVWMAIIVFTVMSFIHIREKNDIETVLRISELKIENLEKEIAAIKNNDALLEKTIKDHHPEQLK